jgi:DNA repair protein SbcD/Mre11
MRILHTSDWHLGRTLEGRSRLPEQKEFIEALCGITEEENIHLVIIAGDVFDTYNPSAAAEELFFEALDKLSCNGRRAIIVIAGNHDNPDRLRAAHPLAQKQGIFLAGYPGENLKNTMEHSSGEAEAAATKENAAATMEKVVLADGGPGWIELKIPGCHEHAIILLLPYPSEKRLNEILSYSLEEKAMQKAYSDRISMVFQEGAVHFRRDTVNLAAGHLFVLGGSISDSERDIAVGGAYAVEPAAMPSEAHYVALGHLHRPQKVRGVAGACRYSGSPLYYSFSEANQPKEVVIVEAFPQKEAEVKCIPLNCGKPMLLKRFSSYEEAYQWCGAEENLKYWLHIEIECNEPLTNIQLEELNKLHSGIIFRRVILPGTVQEEKTGQRISELSVKEQFLRFVARETGNAPEEELMNLFLELIYGGESNETD